MTVFEIIKRLLAQQSGNGLEEAIDALSHETRVIIRENLRENLKGIPLPRNLYYDYTRQEWIPRKDRDMRTTNTEAMNAVQAVMDRHEWSANTLDEIADIVRASGRQVRPPDVEDLRASMADDPILGKGGLCDA